MRTARLHGDLIERITLWAPSASSLSISTPRLIGPGCMMRQSGLSNFARCFVRPKSRMYSPKAGKIFLSLPLVLDAEQVDNVRRGQHLLEVVRNGSPELFERAPARSPRSHERDTCTRVQKRAKKNIRTRDTAEQNVADRRDVQTCHRAFLFANRMRSSSPCVGCSCAPSPALITLAPIRVKKCGAPAELCRRTMMSA